MWLVGSTCVYIVFNSESWGLELNVRALWCRMKIPQNEPPAENVKAVALSKMKRCCESWYEPVFLKEEWVGVITFHCKWSSAVTMVFLRASTNTRLGFIVNHKCVFFSLDSAPVFTDKVSEEKGPCQDSALNHYTARAIEARLFVAFSYGHNTSYTTHYKTLLTLISNLSGLRNSDVDLIQRWRTSYSSAG